MGKELFLQVVMKWGLKGTDDEASRKISQTLENFLHPSAPFGVRLLPKNIKKSPEHVENKSPGPAGLNKTSWAD